MCPIVTSRDVSVEEQNAEFAFWIRDENVSESPQTPTLMDPAIVMSIRSLELRAKVVVNDLGGSGDGTGASDMADAVVEEIKAFFGNFQISSKHCRTIFGSQSID